MPISTPLPVQARPAGRHRACLCGAALLALPVVARAQTMPGTPVVAQATQGPSTPSARQEPALVNHSPLALHTTPGFSSLPQTRNNPTKQQAPQSIHTYGYGVFDKLDGSAAGFGPVGRYAVTRWAEDWSALRDPALRDDAFDPLKFIPLNPGKSIYLTLSGESRLKNWFETRPFLGQSTPNDSGRMTLRNLVGADLHLGEHLRVYGELVNGDAGGWAAYGYSATYRTRLDVQQLFAEAKGNILGAKTGLMVGRQEFLDAPNYVLYLRETPDLPLSWNGVRGYAIWPRFRLDAYDFVQTNTTPPAMFHDNESWDDRLFGADATYALPDFKVAGRPGTVFADLFYIGYLVNSTAAAIATATGTQSGTTHRDNIGTRIWGRAGPIEFSIGGLHQGGEFRPLKDGPVRDVDAYSINGFAGWRFAGLYGRPMAGVQADLFSGGNDKTTTGAVGTYITPFNPQSNYLDTTTYFTESNLVNIAPTVEVAPTASTLLRLRFPLLWRDSTDDAVYGTGRIYGFRTALHGGYVGSVPQLNVAWRVTRHLTWTHDLARYLASSGMRKAGASDGTYYLSTLAFRF